MKRHTVVIVFLFNNDRVLLIKHKKKTWLPVGGHVEKGEDILEALKREIKEEINLSKINYVMPKKIYNDSEKRRRLPLPFYIQEKIEEDIETIIEFAGIAEDIKNLKILNRELEDYKWFTIKELEENKEVMQVIKEKSKLALSFINRRNAF